MIVLIKIAFVITLLLVLIRLKLDLGLALFVNSLLIALLFGMTFEAMIKSVWAGAVSRETLELAGIIILVLYLGEFLQRSGAFRAMVDSLKNVVHDDRLILAIPSAFIGLLPMMAGAMLGAPIVDEAGRRWDLTPPWKTFYNYWFRHIWEYWWPLYLNVILAAAIFQVPIKRISLFQFPFTLVALAAGLVILFSNVSRLPKENRDGKSWKDVLRIFSSIWPIILTILLIFLLRMDMLLALALSSLLTQLLARLPKAERLTIIRESLSLKIVWLIVALMIFKKVLETSGALDSVVRVISPHGFSAYFLLFAAPFFVGLLTGVNQAFVAISFPLLIPIIGRENPDMVLMTFAYVSGFAGILLSPAHLCLALTADYFKADMKDVYRILIWPVAVIFAAALLELLVFRIF